MNPEIKNLTDTFPCSPFVSLAQPVYQVSKNQNRNKSIHYKYHPSSQTVDILHYPQSKSCVRFQFCGCSYRVLADGKWPQLRHSIYLAMLDFLVAFLKL